MSEVDFNDLKRNLLGQVEACLDRWLPGGKNQGMEYVVRNPTRADSSPGSFKINTITGRWSDFATGDSGGDLISLYAYLNGLSQHEAAMILSGQTKRYATVENSHKPEKDKWVPILPIPQCAFRIKTSHPLYGIPSSSWKYRDANGNILCIICRVDKADGTKEVLPLTYCLNESSGKEEWRWQAIPSSRPLYGLEKLSSNPDAYVIVTEGEKAADAAQSLFPECLAMTSSGGSSAAHKSDWSVLKDRVVILSPDNDEAGKKYIAAVEKLARKAGAKDILLLNFPSDSVIEDGKKAAIKSNLPEGWDLADAIEEGWTADLVKKLTTGDINNITSKLGDSSVTIMPESYLLKENGVYFTEVDKEGNISENYVCSPLEVIALTRDSSNENWGRLLKLIDPDGNNHEWAMPSELLAGDGNDYRRELNSLGLRIGYGTKCKQYLHNYLSSSNPTARARCVDRTGWVDGLFILPDQTFGHSHDEKTLLQTVHPISNEFKTKGTLEDWVNNINPILQGNSRLIFAVCASFAAPLIHLAGEESVGFHFRGMSSIGKTTLLIIAGSVWGGGGISGFIRQWRATANGIESMALQHCDTLLCLDEISQISGKEAGEVAYMLANGSGKQRSRRDGTARPPALWRILTLSTGEVSLSDKMLEAGQRSNAGQEVRVIDIAADAGKGYGIFENLHQFKNGDEFAREIKRLSQEYYGTPSRRFIEFLVDNEEKVQTRVREIVTNFTEAATIDIVDGQVKRVAARFGLLKAAGIIAVEAGILHLTENQINDAVQILFAEWLDNRGGGEPAEIGKAFDAIKLFLEQHGSSRFESLDDANKEKVYNRAGFIKKYGDKTEYLIFPEVFKTEILKGFDLKIIKNYLIEKGYLILDAERKVSKTHHIPGMGAKRMITINSEILNA